MKLPSRIQRRLDSQNREVRIFLFSQNFADGLRVTLAVLLPSLILAQFGQFVAGIGLSLGAFCVSLGDAPGPLIHKRNGMLFCLLVITLVSLLTGFARMHMFTLGIEILILSFFFSMFTVYGNRLTSIGTAGLLVLILMIEKRLTPQEVLVYSALIFSGGLWYFLVSMLFFSIRPYRQAERALADCIMETADFLKIKADFYDVRTHLDEDYKRLIDQQLKVSTKQDTVRELLFKSRIIVRESTNASRLLMLTFVDLVDLYEKLMSTSYDYDSLRQKFSKTTVLDDVSALIRKEAAVLDQAGYALLTNRSFPAEPNLAEELELLKVEIDALPEGNEMSKLVLKKILVNLRSVNKRVTDILSYFQKESIVPRKSSLEYARFAPSQSYDPKLFIDNFSFRSSSFRHALRVMTACIAGFIAAKLIAYGHHSYWILLTITVILKPAFSLTKQRNIQRLLGTVFGGIIGVLIIYYVKEKVLLFSVLLLFMLMAYSFQRLNYVVMVFFVTGYVLILFKFLGLANLQLAEERLFDTVIGSIIAFTASYLLFPAWESEKISVLMQKVLQANMRYLSKFAEILSGKKIDMTEYKLARKEVYVSSANLSGTFQRMLSEPKGRQFKIRELHRFLVLNHVLSENIASVNAASMENPSYQLSKDGVRLLKRTFNYLKESYLKLANGETKTQPLELPPIKEDETYKDPLLNEQLAFIQKLSGDICKISGEFQ